MKTLITKIFNENNFLEIKIENPHDAIKASFFGNYTSEMTNFYIILYVDNISKNFVSEKVHDYYEAIMSLEEGFDQRIDKNLSMLVCYEYDDDNNFASLSKKFYEIEEDPYYFKKYLLMYSKEEKIILLNETQHEKSITEFINSNVNNISNFEEFKKKNDDIRSITYQICSKIMIKIPFLTLNHELATLENLSEKIKLSLENEKLDQIRSIVLSSSDLDSDEFLDKILAAEEIEVDRYE